MIFRQKRRLREERDFLLMFLAGGSGGAGFRRELDGLSAQGLVRFAIEGIGPDYEPADVGDLGRCERAYAAAPDHLKVRMLPRLREYRERFE